MPRRRVRRLLLPLACGLLATGPGASGPEHSRLRLEVVAVVAPSGAAAPAEDRGTVGSVLLVEEGSVATPLRFPLGTPFEAPPGHWIWHIESTGYASALPDVLPTAAVAERLDTAGRWAIPVFPACNVHLLASDPPAAERVIVLTLASAVRVPLFPVTRPRAWIPSGDLLVLSYRGTQLLGMAANGACTAGAQIDLAPPPPPPPQRAALLAEYEVPEAFPNQAGAFQFELWNPAGVVRSPTAISQRPGWVGAYFLDLPALDGDWRIEARHPGLRTHGQPVVLSGGRVVRLLSVSLLPRPDVEIDVDYRPLVEHVTAQVRLERRDPSADAAVEGELGEPRVLEPGLQRLTFAGLDTGTYRLLLEVDEQVVLGGPDRVASEVTQEDEVALGPFSTLAEEFEVYGHILWNGAPVDGAILLDCTDPSVPAALRRSRRLPTDGQGLYHWTYFGARSRFDPADEGEEPERSLRPAACRARACADGGPCRPFGPGSLLSGSGRVDIEVGEGRDLLVRVSDARDGSPLNGARVVVENRFPDLVLRDGRIEEQPPREAHALAPRSTDADGIAAFRIAVGDDTRIDVDLDGYHPGHHRVAAGEDALEVAVALKPESERRPTRLLLAPTGQPLPQAFLLVIRTDGVHDFGCAALSDGGGTFELEESCAEGGLVVLLDARAAFQAWPAEIVLGSDELLATPMPPQTLTVRVVDDTGLPAGHLPLRLLLSGYSVGQEDVMVAAARSGHQVFQPWTDATGQTLLRGLTPEDAGIAVLRSDDPERPATTTISEVGADGVLGLQVVAP